MRPTTKAAFSRSQAYYRAMNALMIRNESGLIVPMRFADSQEIIWRNVAPVLDVGGKLWYIVLKGRQVYSTTFFTNLVFLRTLERPNTNSLIIAQDLDTSGEIFGKSRTFYDHLPLPKFHPGKVKELTFPLDGGASHLKVL